jgi:hypothetical protein
MNRSTVIRSLAIVVLVGAGAAAARAQDKFFTFATAAFVDIPVVSPCGPVRAASMTVYDKNAWVVFTCTSGEVVLRRYLNPNDNAVAPTAVYTVADPTAAVPVDDRHTCTVPGMVTGIYGGCVPLNHPNAPRGLVRAR